MRTKTLAELERRNELTGTALGVQQAGGRVTPVPPVRQFASTFTKSVRAVDTLVSRRNGVSLLKEETVPDAERDAFDTPRDFEPTEAKDEEVRVVFVKGYIESIDALVDTLSTVSQMPNRKEARKAAVATAVSVLSKYAGQQLYVNHHGRTVPIEGLWK